MASLQKEKLDLARAKKVLQTKVSSGRVGTTIIIILWCVLGGEVKVSFLAKKEQKGILCAQATEGRVCVW